MRRPFSCLPAVAGANSRYTVAGMPSRMASEGSSTKMRVSYTRLERNSTVCTDFGVNSATDAMNPIQPGNDRPGKLSVLIDAFIPI